MVDIIENISEPFEARLTEFLVQAARILDPFSVEDVGGYGTDIEVRSAPGACVRMSRFCWCDGDRCALCSASCEDLDHLAPADREETIAAWRSLGHVEGHGAPNFHFSCHDTTGSVWWYKYIGRGMATDIAESHFDALVQRFHAWSVLARVEIAKASLERWCTPDILALDEAACAALRRGFNARIECMGDAGHGGDSAVEAVSDDIRLALKSLERQGWQAAQATRMEKMLDTAGIQRIDAGFPEDFAPAFSPAYRLERVLFHEGCFPSNDDPEGADPAPASSEADEAPF